ncbi:MAG: rRNA maturation RNase YbeY [Flavobacteriales bacterium]
MVFASENTDFQLNNEEKFARWIKFLIQNNQKIVGEINYIFCSDDFLHKLNVEHLNHDTFTDIITFDYTKSAIISGDLFISIDRVKENSDTFNVEFQNEIKRVMAHGILHLLGFNDKSEEDIIEMRTKEEEAIALFDTI